MIISLLPLFIFSKIITNSVHDNKISYKIAYLQRQSNILANQIALTGYLTNQASESLQFEIDQLSNEGRLLIIDGTNRIKKDSNLLDENKIMVTEEVNRGLQGQGHSKNYPKERYVEIVTPITDPNSKAVIGVIVLKSSTEDIRLEVELLQNRSSILIIILLFFLLAFSLYNASAITRPFQKLILSINRITEGHMDEKLLIKGNAEIEEIVTAFNRMLNKLQLIEQSRQEFVSNVSHELKTPLTSVKVLAESLLAQDEAPAELYKEFLLDITNEIEREDKIINDLLSLVKLDKKESGLNITTIEVNTLLEQILKRLTPIAARQNVELIFESFRDVKAELDEVKITLAFSNLIENGIKYNREDGWVRVSLNADHKFLYLKVSDSGIGIPEDALEHVFDRFYRVDKARSRETGGTGLGLAIARNTILMHKGAIKVYSKEDEGTTFTVRVPLHYVNTIGVS